ncbi:uncharacterized protein [Branchiostoma lanceolatum]|uniref:uncharacterized protein isoform X1 n=1 Tax=Branchiostoma lanceolatum TaxID=7740 RepID=UPI003456C2DA
MTARRASLFALVLFVAILKGSSCTAVQSNLNCCQRDLSLHVSSLTCWTTCHFRNIPASLPPNLKQLWIQQQNFTRLETGDVPRHDILKSLSIVDCNVVTLQPGTFENLPSLTTLVLRRNKIKRLEAGTFKGLVQLYTLSLEDNKIYHISRKAFAGLDRLGTLSLRTNCLSSIPEGIPSKVKGDLVLSSNPITSIADIDELRRFSSLHLLNTQLQCDCKLRGIKKWLLENQPSRWHIWCMVGATRKGIDIRKVGWEDLRCTSPDVTVTLDNGTVTGNVSFTCRTVCQEGLLFLWIAPNGDYKQPSYEYSMNYTHVSKTLCRGSPITSSDTRRMCYSVLNIPGIGREVNGTYTCQVTADHTDNASASAVLTVSSGTEKSTRGYSSVFPTTIMAVTPPSVDKGVGEATTNRPGFGLSTDQLIFAGLGSFCGCTIVFAVIAACVSKCKEARQMDSSNAQRNAVDEQHGTDDGSSDTDGPRGGHYENDDQISGTNEGRNGQYENDDPFSGTNGTKDGQYENEDQFSNTEGATGGQYENDDQISGTKGERNGQYENDDQFSGTNGAKDGQCENEDQFSNTEGATGGQYENDDQISGTKGDRNGQYENEDQFSDTEGAVGGHYENEDQFSDDDVTKHSHKTALGKPTSGGKGNTSSTGRDKRNRCSHNKRGVVKTRAMPNNKTNMTISRIVAFHAKAHVTGHYDNERIDVGRNLSDRKATATSASGGASHDKKQTAGHYDNDKNAKGLTLNNSIKTDNDSDSYHDYMSLPENTASGRETGRQEEDEPCESLASAAESDSDHDYMSVPENKAASRETGRGEGEEQCESLSEDNNPVPASASAAEVSEHGYVKLPLTENTDDNLDNTCMKLSGTEKVDDNSNHTYVKLPGTENVEDNSNHTCVTKSVEDNSDHTCVTENVEDD